MDTPWPAIVALVTAATPVFAQPNVIASLEHPAMNREHSALGEIHVTQLDDPRVRVEPVSLTVRDVGNAGIVVMSMTATSTAERWHSATLMVSVPRGAHVVGLALVQGGRRYDAEPMPAQTASEQFIESTRVPVDPALAELVEHGLDHDGVRLSIFPLSNERDATVELTVVVPRFEKLVVDLVGKHDEHRASDALAPTDADLAIFHRPSITARTSLYVAPFDDGTTSAELTTLTRDQIDALSSCNRGSDVASVGVKLVIAADGHVRRALVTSPDAEVSACVAGVLEHWHFTGGVPVVDHVRVSVQHH